jgi:hypothetical protein
MFVLADMQAVFKGQEVRNVLQSEMAKIRSDFTAMLLSLPILSKRIVDEEDFEGKEFISIE